MDFFEREDHARRQTLRLLIMFAASVAVIILAVYLVIVVTVAQVPQGHHGERAQPQEVRLWDPQLFLAVALGTSAIVALASMYKIAELSAGGETVALMLGGRALHSQTTDLAEQRLLNVVEEMALASGIPVPPVFVLDREPGINAFAAGHRPGDAVVAVSRGALDYLSRDELQGVLGHEFSHILNGDMRLNLRLIGVVFGILMLSIVGYYMIRIAGVTSSRNEKEGGGRAAILLIGLALCILGAIGQLLGQIIRSAISRQREFLADASSVQFTRNPAALAGALKKIGGLEAGSRIRDGHAQEVSHMFFSNALGGSLLGLFATHPPLAQRIKLLEPDFDGRYPAVTPVGATLETAPAAGEVAAAAAAGLAALSGGGPAPRTRSSAAVLQGVGSPQTAHLDHARGLVTAMPEPLTAAARDPFTARLVVFTLLLSRDDPAVRGRQREFLQTQLDPPAYRLVEQLAGPAEGLAPEGRLPLADLTVPALKRLSPQQYAEFRRVIEALIAADGSVDLFEFCLRVMLFSYLDVQFGLKRPPAVRYRTVDAVAGPATVVLSLLAGAGQSDTTDIERAFQAGAAELHLRTPLIPAAQCTYAILETALERLAQSSPAVKRAVIAAMVACIAAEGKVTLEESELLRAIAAALACPVPPLLPQYGAED
jgi:Zn-dependent protease with chaperone function